MIKKKWLRLGILVACFAELLNCLVGCSWKILWLEYPEYEFSKEGTKYTLKMNGEVYESREDANWFPNYQGEHTFSNIVGECKGGYIFQTSSKDCFLIDKRIGTVAPYVYRKGFEFSPIAAENIQAAAFTAYGDEGYGKYDKGPSIDATEKIEDILVIYDDKENYVEMEFDYTFDIGDITLRNKEDPGLFHSIPIYFDGNDYYMRRDEKYINCNTIIPEEIEILKKYKKENYF